MPRIVLTLILLSLASEVQAQRRVAPYQPSSPTTSPYLYLTLPENGILPNYQGFVEPLENQQRINLNQQGEIKRLDQNQLQYGPSGVAPTGTAAVYNNLSHYYPGASGGGAQRTGGARPGGGRAQARPRSYQPSSPVGGGMGGGMGGGAGLF